MDKRVILTNIIVAMILVANLILFITFERIQHATHFKSTGVLFIVMFLSMVVALVLLIIRVVRQFKYGVGPTYIIYIVFYFLFVLNMAFDPFKMQVQNEISYEACWLGNGTSGKLKIYEDGLFEIRWNGLLRGGTYKGKYKNVGNEYHLTYFGRSLDRVGDKLILEDNTFYNANGVNGLFLREVYFKVDWCNESSRKEFRSDH